MGHSSVIEKRKKKKEEKKGLRKQNIFFHPAVFVLISCNNILLPSNLSQNRLKATIFDAMQIMFYLVKMERFGIV